MQALIERCCGLDVHQETVVACLLIGAAGTRARKEVRTFRTVRRELEALRDWLKAAGATHVGMESTGVYWRPVYAVLEGHVELIVGNARHIRNVPGRKTDVKDAEWIADLVRHGLIAKSFVPPPPLRELRELLRYRRKLIEAQAAERNRLLRLLETASIKLASVMSDVFGVSGRAMLQALIAGGAAPEEMAALDDKPGQHAAAALAAAVPQEAWQPLSAGAGAKGERLYDWARVRLMRLQQPPWDHWLLVRRHKSKPDQLAYYVVFGPADTSLATLARVAGRRWAIEECFEVAKQEVGLADYEIRSRHGWYRHVTLAMLALALLAAMRVKLKAAAAAVTASSKKGQPEPDLWSISARMKSAISSAACNSSPA